HDVPEHNASATWTDEQVLAHSALLQWVGLRYGVDVKWKKCRCEFQRLHRNHLATRGLKAQCTRIAFRELQSQGRVFPFLYLHFAWIDADELTTREFEDCGRRGNRSGLLIYPSRMHGCRGICINCLYRLVI